MEKRIEPLFIFAFFFFFLSERKTKMSLKLFSEFSQEFRLKCRCKSVLKISWWGFARFHLTLGLLKQSTRTRNNNYIMVHILMKHSCFWKHNQPSVCLTEISSPLSPCAVKHASPELPRFLLDRTQKDSLNSLTKNIRCSFKHEYIYFVCKLKVSVV